MNARTFIALFLCFCSLFDHVAVVGQTAPPGTIATNATENPPATRRDEKTYVLTFNDFVQMKVYQEEDLSTQVRIGKDGTVTLPLIGTITMGGLTLEKASQEVTRLLAKDYLVNPQVSLTIVEYAKRRFTVLGQVQRPGTYEMANEQELNLLQAIAMAGGYTRLGAPWKITVQRIVDGEQRIFKLDADAMSKDRKSKPFIIQPEDAITVGEKLI